MAEQRRGGQGGLGPDWGDGDEVRKESERRAGFGSDTPRYTHDDRKLIRKKFKSHATTQAEVRDCTARLENWQLALVSCGPKMIDFGRVFVKSTVTKSFSVFNDLPASVMVTLNFDGVEELQVSGQRPKFDFGQTLRNPPRVRKWFLLPQLLVSISPLILSPSRPSTAM